MPRHIESKQGEREERDSEVMRKFEEAIARGEDPRKALEDSQNFKTEMRMTNPSTPLTYQEEGLKREAALRTQKIMQPEGHSIIESEDSDQEVQRLADKLETAAIKASAEVQARKANEKLFAKDQANAGVGLTEKELRREFLTLAIADLDRKILEIRIDGKPELVRANEELMEQLRSQRDFYLVELLEMLDPAKPDATFLDNSSNGGAEDERVH